MNQITIFSFAHTDDIERMMVSGCLVVSVDMLPTPTSGDDRFIKAGFPREGGYDIFHRPRECLLKISIHPYSLPYFRFSLNDRVYQFRTHCWGLSMAPKVFTRVIYNIRVGLQVWAMSLWFLVAWLVFIWEKSRLKPTGAAQYLVMLSDTIRERVLPTLKSADSRFWLSSSCLWILWPNCGFNFSASCHLWFASRFKALEGCRGCRYIPQEIHSMLLSVEVV